MTFEDVLSMLPKSWFGKQARAHQARVIHSLARAAHATCYLGIGNKPIQIALLLSEKFPDGILWILMPCVLSFQATLLKASVFIRKVHPVTKLVTETACLCSSAFMASCKLLATITCPVVKFIRKLV